MIALKPWWVMVRETGVGLLGFAAGVALLVGIAWGYSAWDDRRFRPQCVIDSSRVLVPFVIDTGGPARLGFWELRLLPTRRSR